MLQHRGQDAAGIATFFEDRFYLHKGNGLITDVFDAPGMARLLAIPPPAAAPSPKRNLSM
jgi:amidophosphoribosyltransferase